MPRGRQPQKTNITAFSGEGSIHVHPDARSTGNLFLTWLVALIPVVLFAWAFGALLESLVGFGYPWAFVAPILIAIGIPDLDAIRVPRLPTTRRSLTAPRVRRSSRLRP
jgi:hypothetical protein